MRYTEARLARISDEMLQDIEKETEEAAASLGASRWQTFCHVLFPVIVPSILTGFALAFARALGEFGATLMLAGNMMGKTQTLPLAIYTALELDIHTAQALSLLLVVFAFALLLFLRRFNRGVELTRQPATP